MARTNQGVFHEIREKVKNLKDSFEQEVRLYFRCSDENELYRNVKNCWDIGNDFYSTFAYSANEIYVKAKELEKFIEYSLKTIKFEQESKKKEYEDMFSETSEIRKKIAKLFFDVLELYSRYSISEIEQETLNKFQLYHDLKS